MKKIMLLLGSALLLSIVNVNAQMPDTLRAKATYAFTHIQDTTQRDKPYQEQMILLLGTNASVYLSMEKIQQDEKLKRDMEEQLKNAAPGNAAINLNRGNVKRLNAVELYQYANEKKLITKMRLFNNYLIEDELPAIDWKISNETSVISGLNCQKATAAFKGRNYTAWFCPDLPFQSGPWKLSGLPGLIVEAYDTNKEVVFKFEGFEEVKNAVPDPIEEQKNINGQVVRFSGISSAAMLKAQTIALPKDAIKTTRKEYDKLQDAMKKDPQGFIQSQMAGSGVTLKKAGSTSVTVNSPASGKIVINNPIELPEKN